MHLPFTRPKVGYWEDFVVVQLPGHVWLCEENKMILPGSSVLSELNGSYSLEWLENAQMWNA